MDYIKIYPYIYIDIYREREKEREIFMYDSQQVSVKYSPRLEA